MDADTVGTTLGVLFLVAIVILAIWLMWWSTGQFFTGTQHWAAFWILFLLGGSSVTHRRPDGR